MKEHYSFERIGGTLDDAIGEAYDKEWALRDQGYRAGVCYGADQAISVIKKYLSLPKTEIVV